MTYAQAIEDAWQETAFSLAIGAWEAADGHLDDPTFDDITLFIVNCVIRTAGICSLPAWTMYCGIHGTGTIDVAIPELLRTLVVAKQDVDDTQARFERALPVPSDPVAQFLRVPGFLEVFNVLRNALDDRRDTLRALERIGRGMNRQSFGTPGGPLVPQAPGDAERLWADQPVIAVTQRLDGLVRAAGFRLWVNAASNQYGGRHPPHQGHNTGIEVDLDWTKSAEPSDRVPNLALCDLVPVKETDAVTCYVDPDKGPMTLVPAQGNEGLPTSQKGSARLATWVVIQGIALLGFDSWMYADCNNVRLSLEHLASAVGSAVSRGDTAEVKSWNPEAVHTLSQIEAKRHYNHLHTEFSRTRPCLLDNPDIQDALERQAKVRDDPQNVDRFLEDLSGPAVTAGFRRAWLALNPRPLLPAWMP